jgi:alpha-amylase
MALAFHLAYNYGVPRVLSSYEFTDKVHGPPHDENWNTLSPEFDTNHQCTNGYICEHRWHTTSRMTKFRSIVGDAPVQNWYSSPDTTQQIAFSRGNRGFIAINNAPGKDFYAQIPTNLPDGDYCDQASGRKVGKYCTGWTFTVENGMVGIFNHAQEKEGFIALHIGEKLD